jgi:hypothetical protein
MQLFYYNETVTMALWAGQTLHIEQPEEQLSTQRGRPYCLGPFVFVLPHLGGTVPVYTEMNPNRMSARDRVATIAQSRIP